MFQVSISSSLVMKYIFYADQLETTTSSDDDHSYS